jgi:hypothetical protein
VLFCVGYVICGVGSGYVICGASEVLRRFYGGFVKFDFSREYSGGFVKSCSIFSCDSRKMGQSLVRWSFSLPWYR